MAVAPNPALERARQHVARSTQLLDRQMALIETLESTGWDTYLARSLLYTMYRSQMLMVEHLDRLEGPKASWRRRPGESLDEWVQLLTLARHPRDGSRGSH